MRHGLGWSVGPWLLVAALVSGCQGLDGGPNNPGGNKDAGVTDSGVNPTGLDAGPTLPVCTLASGCVGAPCIADSDCKEGNAATPKVCFKSTFLNNPNYVDTPGGYCSLKCTSDADCGTGYCYKPPGEKDSYCMAQCNNASTCRHPGYACTFEAKTAICFPDKNLDCSPSAGSCLTKVDTGVMAPGGCIRSAYEDKGLCHPACVVGTKTCGPSLRLGAANPIAQHCIQINTTIDSQGRQTGDKWNGPVCVDLLATPIAEGQPCSFWDECADGYQCDRANPTPTSRVCRRLCAQGTGVQDPGGQLYRPAGAVLFTNTCTNAGETCVNGLSAGVGDGKAGLCLKPN